MSVAVGKTPRRALLFDRLLYWPHIAWAHCHHYETKSALRTNRVHHFRYVKWYCSQAFSRFFSTAAIKIKYGEIKSGSDLGTRLYNWEARNVCVWLVKGISVIIECFHEQLLTLLEGITNVPDRQVTKTGKSSIIHLLTSSFFCLPSTRIA